MASRPISPAEPTKKHPPPIQPNAHPYAVKTTSSALLSRSSSSPHSAHYARHHYVPSLPSRIPTGTRVRHRHSSSLSSVEGGVHDLYRPHTVPEPLPAPPSTVVASSENPSVSLKHACDPKLTHQLWTARTAPSNTTESLSVRHSYEYDHNHSRPGLHSGLSPNPKEWNADEVATYLEMSLSTGSNTEGEKDDFGFAGILECVRTRGLTGRELLRLTDADLASTPLSDVQCTKLLERSRTLRTDVLRGRIYVDSYHSHQVSDNSNDIYSQSARSSTPFHSVRGASVSAEDLRLLDNNTSEDEGAFAPSPAMSLHRSNSVSDASAQRYKDLARMRMRRRGRVKGLVETWERASTSGGEYSTGDEGSMSGSEAESESEIDQEPESNTGTKRSSETLCDSPSAVSDELSHDACSSAKDSAVVPQEPSLLTPPPPYTHKYTTLGDVGDEEEEPSIEELLASSSGIPLKGARAWEADFCLGETVKRIPISVGADEDGISPLVIEADALHSQDHSQQTGDGSVRSKGSMRRRTGSKGNNSNSRKRVVTAIFTGSLSDDISENPGDEIHIVPNHRHANRTNVVVCDEILASSNLQNDPDSVLRALEESIAATRVQLEAFKLRLEEVEADTARHEAMLTVQFSDIRGSFGPELGHRHPEANKQVTAAEPCDKGSFAPRNGDVEGWEAMSLADIARAIFARTMGWLFPYGHLGVHVLEDRDGSPTHTDSPPETNARYHPPVKRNGRLAVARMSCSIILVSFAVCAAVFRRMGFGRWVCRP